MTYSAVKNRYNGMQYRRCERSGLKLPIISLGLYQNFGENDNFQNNQKMIFYAFDHGITHFDIQTIMDHLMDQQKKLLEKSLITISRHIGMRSL